MGPASGGRAYAGAMIRIPEEFAARIAGRGPDAGLGSAGLGSAGIGGDTWLAGLPQLAARFAAAWDLTADGAPWFGENALVIPVMRAGQEPAVLKLTWPHVEARHEHLALRAWDGRGAVRLLAASPADQVLLLERLDGSRDLTSLPILEACEEIGRLFTVLDRPPLPQVDTVASKAERWQEELADAGPSVPRRLTEQARSALDDLLADAPPARLVHEDLHDMNVLAPLEGPRDTGAHAIGAGTSSPRSSSPGRDSKGDTARGAWLAIDPKPVAGEWAYAVAPIVWNREDAAAHAHSLRTHVRLRAEVVADAAGLDLDRVQAWTLVRLTVNAVWAAQYPQAAPFRGRMIALAKAFSEPLGW